MKNHFIRNTICVIFLTGLLINQNPVDAQTFVNREWVQVLGTPDTIQWLASVINLNDQLITTGNTFTLGQQANILTTAYDEDGNIQWQQQWNGPQNGGDYGAAVTTDDQGNIFVAGASQYSTDSTFDIVLIMYDHSGTEMWYTSYSGEGLNNIPFAIVADNENHLFIAGTGEEYDNGYDYLLLKFTVDGELLWDVRYDYNGGTDIATSLVLVNGGQEIAVTGGSETTGGNWDYTTVLYSSQGVMLSVDRQPSDETAIEKPKDIVRDAQNNFYLTGVESNGAVNQVKLMKLGHDLQPQWIQFSTSGYEEESNTVAIDSYSNSYVGGWIEEVAGNRKTLLMKYDPNGNLAWAQSFIPDPLKPHAEITKISIENNLINFVGFATDGISSDIFTGQLAADGELNWLKNWSNTGNSIDFPTSIVSTQNNVYVSGRTNVNNAMQWVTVRYSYFELPPVIVDDTINQTSYLDCQIVVKINQKLLNHPFHNNRELQFHSLHQLLHDSIIIQMEVKTGVEFSSVDMKVVKLHWDLTPADTLSVSRLGDTVRIPDFWNTLILEMPEGSNLPAVRDSLLSFTCVIFDADLAYIDELQNVPNDLLFPHQWGLHAMQQNAPYPNAHINILPAWDIETGENYIKIGVIDDVVYWDHPDFKNSTLPSNSIVAGGWNYTNNSNHASKLPEGNHGTAVAGIFGAIRNNTKGIAGIAGGNGVSNPGVQVYSFGAAIWDWPFLVIPNTYSAHAIRIGSCGINGYGLHAINCSFAGTEGVFYLYDALVSAFINNCVIIAGRGNSGDDVKRYPACYDDKLAISVGASGTDGTYKRKNEFGHPSNTSNGTPGYGSSFNHFDLIAPGVIELVYTTHYPISSSSYTSFHGTSAATPHVTGVAGLLLSRHHPSQGYPNGLAPEDVQHILKSTATDISGSPPNTIGINFPAGPDPFNGHGRLNAEAALNYINMPYYQVFHSPNLSPTQITLIESDKWVFINRAENYGGYPFYSSQGCVADLYRVDYVHNVVIPQGYNAVDAWARGSSSYGAASNKVWIDILTDRYFAEMVSFDPTTNPISIHLRNYYYHIKTSIGSNNPININYPSPASLTAAFSVLLNNPTAGSPEPEEELAELKGFPNPTSEHITFDFSSIDFTEGRMTIYDMFGRNVEERAISAADKGQITIPVANLAKGVYLCVLVANNKRYTYRFCRL